MSDTLTFASVQSEVPSIHVYRVEGGGTEVEKQQSDPSVSDHPSRHTRGTGTRRNPYCYRGVNPPSAHYRIVHLWLKLRPTVEEEWTRGIYIRVNDWLLQLTPEGVTAEDSQRTRLLPIDG